jgi:hypothetical protein
MRTKDILRQICLCQIAAAFDARLIGSRQMTSGRLPSIKNTERNARMELWTVRTIIPWISAIEIRDASENISRPKRRKCRDTYLYNLFILADLPANANA